MPTPKFSFALLLTLSLSFLSIVPASAFTAAEHFRNAQTYRLQNQNDAAIIEYRKGLEKDPDSVDAHVRLGDLLVEEKGDVDGAISEYMTALSLDPACNFCQKQLDDALEKKNSKVQDQVARGNQLYGLGQLQRAAAAYRIAVQIDAKDPGAHNSLSWTLYRLGNLEEALKEVNEALRLKPDDSEFVNTLACVQYDLGRTDEALATWRKAISLSKTPSPADLYGVAVALLVKGDKKGALENFKEAIKSDARYGELEFVRDRIGMSVHTCASHEALLALVAKEKEEKPKGK